MKLGIVVALSLFAMTVSGAHDLSQDYRFSATLDFDGQYELHWNYNLSTQTISFAVRVQTTGWVGFGISPNGGMVGSDVVIGWVERDGTVQFNDRYAEQRALPPIDASQDWFLVSGEEENGFTILEFSRNLTSCDDRDLNILADTTRVIFSWNSVDPSDAAGNIIQHQSRGSTSLNLLGGLNTDQQDPPDTNSFIIQNNNLIIPDDRDTTYWCSGFQLPAEVREQEQYIFKFSPFITDESFPHVHHILAYHCDFLEPDTLGGSGAHCDEASNDLRTCKSRSQIVAAWAVGGADFIYPENVAYSIGGPGNAEYLLLEMHYDNPVLRSGVIDSSGFEFFYTSNPPVHEAGILGLGHGVTRNMVIPPKADNFVIQSLCPSACTQSTIPSEGITVFANLLHTHLAGHGLVLQHFRPNEECGVLEELEPIDRNLQYDFNYQQINILPREVQVLPGDSLGLTCFYTTTENSQVTLGGESTHEEMCLTFPVYYPRIPMSICVSVPQLPDAYTAFGSQHISANETDQLIESLDSENEDGIRTVLDQLNWTPNVIQDLQDSVLNSGEFFVCSNNGSSRLRGLTSYPTAQCSYEFPDICTDFQPLDCCDRLLNSTTPSPSEDTDPGLGTSSSPPFLTSSTHSSLPLPSSTSHFLDPSLPLLSTPHPVPASSAPLPLPASSAPLPLPASSTPLPLPASSASLPLPASSPLPLPASSAPLPLPASSAPLPLPTSSAPLLLPTSSTPLPLPASSTPLSNSPPPTMDPEPGMSSALPTATASSLSILLVMLFLAISS